jgi:hypothetical protein
MKKLVAALRGNGGSWLERRILQSALGLLFLIGSWYFARNERRLGALEFEFVQVHCEHVVLAGGSKDIAPCNLSLPGAR